MKHLNSSWETRRYPRPKRNELTRLARRAAELAGLPADFDWDLDAARREGEKRADSSYSREVVLYIVHGLLHSAGEDDLSPAPRRRMRRREREVLAGLEPEFDFTALFPPPGFRR